MSDVDAAQVARWISEHPWLSVSAGFAAGAVLAVAESVPRTRAIARRVVASLASTALAILEQDAAIARFVPKWRARDML